MVQLEVHSLTVCTALVVERADCALTTTVVAAVSSSATVFVLVPFLIRYFIWHSEVVAAHGADTLFTINPESISATAWTTSV